MTNKIEDKVGAIFGSPTQQEIFDRLDNVSESVNQYLSSRGINFGYEPKTKKFRNWYGREFNVDYFAQLGFNTGSGKLYSNKIKINILRGTRLIPPRLRSNEEIADTLLHEKIHQDIGIIETPLACIGISAFAVLTKSFLGTAGLAVGYVLAREFIVDGIKNLKYSKKTK